MGVRFCNMVPLAGFWSVWFLMISSELNPIRASQTSVFIQFSGEPIEMQILIQCAWDGDRDLPFLTAPRNLDAHQEWLGPG